MATSPDGSFRIHMEPRTGGLLEVLGPLKDELIGLGWELESEKHFASAINLQLGQGLARNRVTRVIWLLERNPTPPGQPDRLEPAPKPPAPPVAAPASPPNTKPTAVSVLCEAQAKGPGLYRLGAAHRGICQSIEVSREVSPRAPPAPLDPAPR
jgi:hypothetical protein